MKKFVLWTLVITIVFTLCACGGQTEVIAEEVKNVESMIDAIGTVTLESEKAIENAELVYSILSETNKAKVENAEVLTEARNTLNALLEEASKEPETVCVEISLENLFDYYKVEKREQRDELDAEGNVTSKYFSYYLVLKDSFVAADTDESRLQVGYTYDELSSVGFLSIDFDTFEYSQDSDPYGIAEFKERRSQSKSAVSKDGNIAELYLASEFYTNNTDAVSGMGITLDSVLAVDNLEFVNASGTIVLLK